MALEQVFKCPRTLRKLRTGPLGKFQEGFCNWLLEHGFRLSTICKHLVGLSHLNRFMSHPECGIRWSITIGGVETSFKAYFLQCQKIGVREERVRPVSYAVNRFLDFLRDSGLLDTSTEQDSYQPLVEAYLKWMRDYRHVSQGTIGIRRRSILSFLQWLGPEATPEGLLRLSSDKIENFFIDYTRSTGRSAQRAMQAALRTFLRFCFHNGYIKLPLDRAVPALRIYKLATVPRGLSDIQAQRVLGCIERNSHVGRRDYAIVQLLYTYGVRGGQVRALRLEDIDWAQNQILFKASKHGKDSLLPLTEQVGDALLDYLQNSRPAYSYPHVFLTSRAPYHPLSYSSALSAIVEHRIKAAGIQIPSKGAYAFRHYAEFRIMPSNLCNILHCLIFYILYSA